MTITEIANAVGFNGGSYYAEAFRKWCGDLVIPAQEFPEKSVLQSGSL